jgi:hypothetical protein
MKFQLSLALHFATLALVTSALGVAWRDAVILRWVAVASLACTVFEVGYIMVQANREQPSHFNLNTSFHAAMYVLMAIGAVVITMAAAVVGAAAWLDSDSSLGPATRLGVAVGLIGGSALTLIVAFRMGGALTHHVGVELADAPRMPLTGWSLTVGDRRVPHFFATHLMQAAPMSGLLADLVLPRIAAFAVVMITSGLWTTLTLLTFHQANRGLPLHRWPLGSF